MSGLASLFNYTLLPLLVLGVPLFLAYKYIDCKRGAQGHAQHQPQPHEGPKTLLTRKFKRIIAHEITHPKLSISCNGFLFDLFLNPIPEGLALLQKMLKLKQYDIFLIIRVNKQDEQEKIMSLLETLITESRASFFEECKILQSRIMFCKGVNGNEAMVRSLSSSIHVQSENWFTIIADGVIVQALYKYVPHLCLFWKNEVFSNNLDMIDPLRAQMPSRISYVENYEELLIRL